jgi:hypothetical protein
MKLFRAEEGQTLVFTALSMAILLGFMGLALDVSLLFRQKRRVQTAADAAAIAAGIDYYYHGSSGTSTCGVGIGSIQCAAQLAATANGITDVNQVNAHTSPTYGTHTGAEYVEVIITQPNSTIFMQTFGKIFTNSGTSPFSSVNVAARAVSGITPGENCMFALDKTAKDAFDVQGSAVVNTPNCSIQINSSDNTALCTTGNATINSDAIRIVGAQNPSGKCNKSQANAQTGVEPIPDPFAGLANPTCVAGNTSSATAITQAIANALPSQAQPISGTPNATVTCFSGNNVTINGGVTLGTAGGNQIFVFQDGVNIGGTVTVNGTIDVAGGNFTQGNSALTLTAPADTNSTYNGIGIYVPSTNTSVSCGGSYSSFKGTPAPGGCLQIQFGSGSGNLDGMIYAPAAAVYMQDNGGGTVVTAIIADEIYDKSSNLKITNNYSFVHTTSPLNQVSLVE